MKNNKYILMKNYLIGFTLSLFLTFLFLILVKNNFFTNTKIIIIFLGILQIIIHMFYFLKIYSLIKNIWYIVSLIFTIIIILIMIIGSLWIMNHLNYHIKN